MPNGYAAIALRQKATTLFLGIIGTPLTKLACATPLPPNSKALGLFTNGSCAGANACPGVIAVTGIEPGYRATSKNVIPKVLYPLVLAVCHPASSDYITIHLGCPALVGCLSGLDY